MKEVVEEYGELALGMTVVALFFAGWQLAGSTSFGRVMQQALFQMLG